MTLTPAEKAELKAAAEMATQGPWKIHTNSRYVIAEGDVKRTAICDYETNAPQAELNCKFIATANPTAILSLLSEVERLQAATLGLLSPALHWEISHE